MGSLEINRHPIHLLLACLRTMSQNQPINERSKKFATEPPELRLRYWGRRVWARSYFSTTSGNVTDDIIKQYLELHSSK
jgi:REP element-mobilizing transposase RayT